MITAKEEANNLCMTFLMQPHTEQLYYGIDKELAKQCAWIAVDRIIEEVAESADDEVKFMRIIYWETVKREINKL